MSWTGQHSWIDSIIVCCCCTKSSIDSFWRQKSTWPQTDPRTRSLNSHTYKHMRTNNSLLYSFFISKNNRRLEWTCPEIINTLNVDAFNWALRALWVDVIPIEGFVTQTQIENQIDRRTSVVLEIFSNKMCDFILY